MGGVRIDPACQTAQPGLLVAGEDAGGVHGANRLGGNGVAESTVFGAIAGETAVMYCQAHPLPPFDRAQADLAVRRAGRFLRPGQSPYPVRRRLNELMWEHGGLVREAAGLKQATRQLHALNEELEAVGVPGGRAFNPGWQEALNLENLLTVAPLVIAAAAHREESRGSHYRCDFPQPDDRRWLRRVSVRQQAGAPVVSTTAVTFSRLLPEMASLPA
jgi:succinate dehydrogenase / fumarate reductase flavoprotein subunit/fumarate reductase flavoprotein subunit